VLAVFDLTKPDSFDHIATWIDEVHQHTPPDLPIVLVGNKLDLVDQRKVSREQATALAEQLNLSYMETSALNATNVEKAFNLLVSSIYQKKKPKQIESASSYSPQLGNSRAVTLPVPSDPSLSIDKPIRLPSDKKASSPKKSGCCVIS
jgi:Ras-related protein Rab-11A